MLSCGILSADWYDGDWPYRVKITVDDAEVDADLDNFPVYVDLSDLPAEFHTNVNQTDARDIRVTEADGTTEVARQVVFYTAGSDTGELHFLAEGTAGLTATGDTEFYIYYGNAAATMPAEDATYGSENVWDPTYIAVYHLQESRSTTAGNYIDATDGDNDGQLTDADSDTVQGTGMFDGKAVDFSGDGNPSDYIQVGALGPTGDVTISFWINAVGHPGANGDTALAVGNWIAGGRGNYGLFWYDDYSDNQRIMLARDGNAYRVSDPPGYGGSWMYMTGTRDGSTVKLYVDSTNQATKTSVASTINTGDVWRIGAAQSAWDSVDGIIDEVRVSTNALSVAWIAAEYSNQNAPATFYTVGAEEANATERRLFITYW